MTPTTDTSVRASIVVDTPVASAFQLFTEGIGSWWPPDHHILQAPLAEMVFEPRVGGRIYDRATDGSECQWATVLVYQPPEQVTFSWNISPQWEIETDPAKVSEVEVRFVPEGSDRTRVELEHRHLDRHGEGWEGMATAVGSPGGWTRTVEVFAAAARNARANA